MASTVKHLRSSTANKRPTASGLADGQLGINTASGTPGVFFKDSAGTVVKVGPAHVGSSAPNVSPAGSAGNSLGELWVNNSSTINGLNYYTGSAFVNLTPSGTTSVAGLVELATNAETQTGTDTVRAVTPSGLQSKISDSTSTTSSTTIASATAVKAAYDLADAALPKSGGRVTGSLEIGPAGSLSFEGSSDDGFETTIAVVNPTADRTITFPNVTGNVVTTGDSGTVTSAMIANSTIVDADISASAEIAVSKLANGAARQLLQTDAAGTGVEWTSNVDIPGTLDVTGATVLDDDLTIPDKIIHAGDTNTVIRFPAADTIAFETGGSERARIDSSGRVLVGTTDTGALVNISANTAEDALRVTQTGAGNALVVEDSANPDDNPFVIDANGRVIQGHTTALALNGTGGTPVQQIHAASTLFAAACYSAVNWGDTVAPPGIFMARARSGAIGTYTIVPNGQSLGDLRFAGADGVEFQNAASLRVEVDDTPSAGIVPGRLIVQTANSSGTLTERMRIDSSGGVGIGTATPDAPLHVAGLTRLNSTDTPATSTTSAIARTTASNNDGNVSLESVANNTSTRHHISFVNPNGIVGSISTNASATAYNTLSDYRLKENIVPLTGAIDRLQQIPVHRFNFIADPDTVVDGFIAHEAAAVVPECVTGEKDQVDENGKPIYQGIDQSKIVPLLTAALQEALQKIEDLETRIVALES